MYIHIYMYVYIYDNSFTIKENGLLILVIVREGKRGKEKEGEAR